MITSKEAREAVGGVRQLGSSTVHKECQEVESISVKPGHGLARPRKRGEAGLTAAEEADEEPEQRAAHAEGPALARPDQVGRLEVLVRPAAHRQRLQDVEHRQNGSQHNPADGRSSASLRRQAVALAGPAQASMSIRNVWGSLKRQNCCFPTASRMCSRPALG